MTALTETGLVNLALREIGDYRIESIDEDSLPAEVARDLLTQTVRMALGAHEWRWAMKLAQLAELEDAPAARYESQWALPSDFIRLGIVADNDTMLPPLTEFALISDDEGVQRILTSTDYVFVEYVYEHLVYGNWPAHFARYAAAMLAAEMAAPLKSTTERERLEKLAELRLGHAKGLDSVQTPVLFRPTSSWLQAMRGNRILP